MNPGTVSFEAEQAREPLLHPDGHVEGFTAPHADDETPDKASTARPFSRIAYIIFMLLGIAMLWAWNMFLAGATYFQSRFKDNTWLVDHFSSAETSVATLTNLGSMLILSFFQKNASYPRRIILALITYSVLFTILALSTFIGTSAGVYFGFLMVVIFGANLSTGFIQNGVFSFIVAFEKKEYTQAVMTGQAIAGILPPLVQIISVLAVPTKTSSGSSTTQTPQAAFIYFITATAVSVITFFAFMYLLRNKSKYTTASTISMIDESDISASQSSLKEHGPRTSVSLIQAFKRVPLLASGVVICYAVTMVYPVFTNVIQSVNGIDSSIFVPLGLLFWNVGDLVGRLIPLIPRALVARHPWFQFSLSIVRLVFIPLYLLCNVKGRGATVSSDFFYLVIVQFLFGVTNGYIGSSALMTAGDWVAPEEREAIGGFMALCTVLGLAIGSLLSFLLGSI